MTELEAVNQILHNAGHRAVASLSGTLPLPAQKAQDFLQDASRRVQSEGWWFNTEYKSYTPDGSNNITVAATILKVRPVGDSIGMNVALNGGNLRNLTPFQANQFTSDLDVCEIFGVDWPDLPLVAQNYILLVAMREFQVSELSDEVSTQVDVDEEAAARKALEDAHEDALSIEYLVDGELTPSVTGRDAIVSILKDFKRLVDAEIDLSWPHLVWKAKDAFQQALDDVNNEGWWFGSGNAYAALPSPAQRYVVASASAQMVMQEEDVGQRSPQVRLQELEAKVKKAWQILHEAQFQQPISTVLSGSRNDSDTQDAAQEVLDYLGEQWRLEAVARWPNLADKAYDAVGYALDDLLSENWWFSDTTLATIPAPAKRFVILRAAKQFVMAEAGNEMRMQQLDSNEQAARQEIQRLQFNQPIADVLTGSRNDTSIRDVAKDILRSFSEETRLKAAMRWPNIADKAYDQVLKAVDDVVAMGWWFTGTTYSTIPATAQKLVFAIASRDLVTHEGTDEGTVTNLQRRVDEAFRDINREQYEQDISSVLDVSRNDVSIQTAAQEVLDAMAETTRFDRDIRWPKLAAKAYDKVKDCLADVLKEGWWFSDTTLSTIPAAAYRYVVVKAQKEFIQSEFADEVTTQEYPQRLQKAWQDLHDAQFNVSVATILSGEGRTASELAAIEEILDSFNEHLRTKSQTKWPDYCYKAMRAFDNAMDDVQNHGWWFQREVVSLTKTIADEFVVPSGVISARTTRSSARYKTVLRDGKLYNLTPEQTGSTWDAPDELVVELVYRRDWTDLPETAKSLVKAKATTMFASTEFGDNSNMSMFLTEEQKAFADLHAEQLRVEPCSLKDNTEVYEGILQFPLKRWWY